MRQIEINDRELAIILDALRLRLDELAEDQTTLSTPEVEEQIDAVRELMADLMGAIDDEWLDERDEPTDLVGHTFTVAEDEFINAGAHARERLKEQRKLQHRRQAFGEFEVQATASEIHRPFADSDPRTARLFKGTATAFISNDPIDW